MTLYKFFLNPPYAFCFPDQSRVTDFGLPFSLIMINDYLID